MARLARIKNRGNFFGFDGPCEGLKINDITFMMIARSGGHVEWYNPTVENAISKNEKYKADEPKPTPLLRKKKVVVDAYGMSDSDEMVIIVGDLDNSIIPAILDLCDYESDYANVSLFKNTYSHIVVRRIQLNKLFPGALSTAFLYVPEHYDESKLFKELLEFEDVFDEQTKPIMPPKENELPSEDFMVNLMKDPDKDIDDEIDQIVKLNNLEVLFGMNQGVELIDGELVTYNPSKHIHELDKTIYKESELLKFPKTELFLIFESKGGRRRGLDRKNETYKAKSDPDQLKIYYTGKESKDQIIDKILVLQKEISDEDDEIDKRRKAIEEEIADLNESGYTQEDLTEMSKFADILDLDKEIAKYEK